MSKIDKLAKTLTASQEKKGTSPYDTTAKVVRVQGNTAWVNIPGGVEETPAVMAVNVSAGDDVRVRVSGGKAYVMGNTTSPPTDDTLAKKAQSEALRATESAEIASQQATIAKESANQAVQDAAVAKKSADAAVGAAARAHAAADEAQESADIAIASADEAVESADTANKAATNALVQLSTVESVVDVLNWITAHGTMTLTTDTGINPAHVYFIVDHDGDYVVGDTHYSIVTEPKAEELGTYYELSVDESLDNYVATHLSLTADGLWLIPDSSGFKVLVSVGRQGSSYSPAGTYIIASDGAIVGKYTSDTVQLGDILNPHTVINGNGMTVYIGSNDVAFFGETTRIGRNASGYSRTEIASTGVQFLRGSTVLANIGYGSGKAQSGTANAPFYSLGERFGDIGNYSMAEGNTTTASGYASHAEGEATTASGTDSHAEGFETVAEGDHSHAEGYGTLAEGMYSHAEGCDTVASGSYSHAGGNTSMASEAHSFAHGYRAEASGNCACAYGYMTEASGANSLAHGYYATASHESSHASGSYTKTSRNNQTVIGQFNADDSSALFIIGNGTSGETSGRKNALTVDVSGNVNIASGAHYKINGSNLSASDVGALQTRPTSIEFQPGSSTSNNGGFIDFHYNRSTADYTSRIIEGASGVLTITGGLRINNHLSNIGTVKVANAAAKTVNNNTNTNLTSISLEAGTWVVTGGVRFPANASGYRRMNISTASASGAADVQLPAVNGASTQLAYTLVVSPTATTTYYLNCYQNSGSNLSMSAGGSENGINFIRAVRIA